MLQLSSIYFLLHENLYDHKNSEATSLTDRHLGTLEALDDFPQYMYKYIHKQHTTINFTMYNVNSDTLHFIDVLMKHVVTSQLGYQGF